LSFSDWLILTYSELSRNTADHIQVEIKSKCSHLITQ